MPTGAEHRLKLVVDNARKRSPLEELVARYDEQIEFRREQLEDDLAFFRGKLDELTEIDPLDYTGLQKIYGEHEQRLQRLLDSITPETIAAPALDARGRAV